MWTWNTRSAGVFVVSLFLSLTLRSQGAQITDRLLSDLHVSGAGGTVSTFTSIPALVSYNNDNTGAANPNFLTFTESFTQTEPYYIDTTVDVRNSGGTTEYRVTKQIVNLLNETMVGVTMQLGTGSGSNFVLASPTSGLDFDFPDKDPAPQALLFSNVDHQSNQIKVTHGVLLTGLANATQVSFSMDIPDGLPNNQFTMREILVPRPIPEPGTWLLSAFGLAFAADNLSPRRRGIARGDLPSHI